MFSLLKPSRQCRWELLWDFILAQSEWPRSIKPTAVHAVKDGELLMGRLALTATVESRVMVPQESGNKCTLRFNYTIYTFGHIPQGLDILPWRWRYLSVFIAVLFTIARNGE